MFTTVVYVALNSLFGHMVEQRKCGIGEPARHQLIQQLNGFLGLTSHQFLLISKQCYAIERRYNVHPIF